MPAPVITITNLNDGINVKSDPSAISEGGVVDCIGFDLTTEGVLETAKGLAANDISGSLPAGTVQCMAKLYIDITPYVLATTASGLYANGSLVDAGFTGRFKAVSFLNNIYLVNGVAARRFDGTSCHRWGIASPSSMPALSVGTHLKTVLDDFEDETVWTANEVDCTVAADAGIFKVGAKSAKFTVAATKKGTSFKAIPVDGSVFPGGRASTTSDYVRFWLYIDVLNNLNQVNIILDVGDGTFTNDYLAYNIICPGADLPTQIYSKGQTIGTTGSESVGDGWSRDSELTTPQGDVPLDLITGGSQVVTLKKSKKQSKVDPKVLDQVLAFWRSTSLFQLKDATWCEIKIPKQSFFQTGDLTKGWANISAVKFEVTASAAGTVNAYIDELAIIGGSDFIGDYWFMYSWGRQDADGNILHESGPAVDPTTKQFIIQGPMTFDRQPLVYGARERSSDSQVTCCIISAIGGTLASFWEVGIISDNLAAGGTLYDVGDNYALKQLVTLDNEPAPPGKDLTLFKNKIWMVGDPAYPEVLRSSDILRDGTLAPESFPAQNSYEPSENAGELTNISILNKQLVVKGDFGEWVIIVNDPVDYLSVQSKKVSDKGLLARDGVIAFETTQVYPSNRGFIETDANQARYILPEVQPLIDSNIASAMGANAGLVSYFSYKTTFDGERTAKVDLYRGKPRFTNISDQLYEWLFFDAKNDTVYVVRDGTVYILDSGYTNESLPEKELTLLLKSRVYRPGKRVAFAKIDFDHNTGGVWYNLDIYVDDAYKTTVNFMSTGRTHSDFRFGPYPGNDFQFIITAKYKVYGQIYFPMRIHHSG